MGAKAQACVIAPHIIILIAAAILSSSACHFQSKSGATTA